jgi:hypothetical protein
MRTKLAKERPQDDLVETAIWRVRVQGFTVGKPMQRGVEHVDNATLANVTTEISACAVGHDEVYVRFCLLWKASATRFGAEREQNRTHKAVDKLHDVRVVYPL